MSSKRQILYIIALSIIVNSIVVLSQYFLQTRPVYNKIEKELIELEIAIKKWENNEIFNNR